MPELKRLHIFPLNPELLNLVLPKAVLPLASNISYHSIQSSPEINYGYVTLPAMEAEKIQKKLNGSILKGSKMQVAEARPEKSKRKLENGDTENAEGSVAKKPRKEKSKREEGVLPGVELPKERKVKRGWTESEALVKSKRDLREKGGGKEKKEKKSKSKPSSHTNEPELLFKTTVPPNAVPIQDEKSSTKKNSKKRKKGETERDVVIHEFSNTTKQPAFLRDTQVTNGKKVTSQHVEGKGWVDETGNVVEPEIKSSRTRSKIVKQEPPRAESAKEKKPRKTPKIDVPTIGLTTSTDTSPKLLNDDETSSSGSSSSDSDNEIHEARQPKTTSHPPAKPTSPSEASSSSSKPPSPGLNRLSLTRSSATPPPPPTTRTSPPPPTSTLETLFKRPQAAASATPKKPNLEVTTKFSFFDPDVDEAPLTGVGLLAPQTPFTRRDLNERGQRSAAPTPDTAMPGKSFWGPDREGSVGDDGDVSGPEGMEGYSLPMLGEAEEEDGEAGKKNAKGAVKKEGEKEESAFAKEFWEKRGERNRATKKRVREAKKEKRRAAIKKTLGKA